MSVIEPQVKRDAALAAMVESIQKSEGRLPTPLELRIWEDGYARGSRDALPKRFVRFEGWIDMRSEDVFVLHTKPNFATGLKPATLLIWHNLDK